MVASAVTKTQFFPQPASPLTEQGVRVDAVHEAFLRLTPLLTDSSRRLHGWTDQRVEMSLRRLRDDVEDAMAAARGDALAAKTSAPLDAHRRSSPHPQHTTRVWNRRTPCGSPTTCTPGSLSWPYFSAVTRGPQCASTYPPSGEQHHSVATGSFRARHRRG